MKYVSFRKLILAELTKIIFVLYGAKHFIHALSTPRPIVIPNPHTPILR
jgi:hypothetical protein